MAFNIPVFKTRAITAIIFAVVMLLGLLWNHWSFFILFSVIHFGCWWEYLGLTEKIYKTSFHIHTKLGFMLLGFGLMLLFCGPAYRLFEYGLKQNFSLTVSGAGFLLLLAGIFQRNPVHLKPFLMALGGLVYISLTWGLMMDLRGLWMDEHDGILELDYGYIIPATIIFSIWINDTMAYIVGSLIGKTPFSKISPKKTWEGTIGGILLSILVIGIIIPALIVNGMAPDMNFPGSRTVWFIIPFLAAIAGTFGDLFESKLKRLAGVKDSGHFMPGHGGFLDRFDSLLFAVPFVWVYVQLL